LGAEIFWKEIGSGEERGVSEKLAAVHLLGGRRGRVGLSLGDLVLR